MNEDGDTLELREVFATVRRGYRWVIGGALLGVVLALALSFVLPPRYQATAAVLLRDSNQGPSLPLQAMGGLGNLLPTSMQSGFETEMEVLTSRSGVEAVIDSLFLQAQVTSPRSTPVTQLLASARFDRNLEPAKYEFTRSGDGYAVDGPGASGPATPGLPYELPGAVLTLRPEGLPDAFSLELVDMDEAVRRVTGALDAGNPGGDVAELVYHASDPTTAAAVPNQLVDYYMFRRRTTDRGVNQRRYEFLLARTDSVELQLAAAEESLRRYQESTGTLDPKLYAEADLERAAELRARLETVTMEADALGRALDAANAGRTSPQALAAFPSFLGNEAINDLMTMLLEQQQGRLEMLERRTASDPSVIAFDERIDQLEGQLVTLSNAYLDGLREQQQEIQQELESYQREMSQVLPEQAQSTAALYRTVEELSQMSLALHAQLLDARLDAITEGGEVRRIDSALPPHEPSFPKIWLNLAIGLFGGLLLGIVGAFGRNALGEQVDHPRDAELATGVPTVLFRPGTPLLLAGVGTRRGVLVVPAGGGSASASVAEHIAATAALQGKSVVLADLKSGASAAGRTGAKVPVEADGASGRSIGEALVPASDGSDGYLVYRGQDHDDWSSPPDIRVAVEELEAQFSLVISNVRAIDDPVTTALLSPDRAVVLVASCGKVKRSELSSAVEALSRVGIAMAGVVLAPGGTNGKRQS